MLVLYVSYLALQVKQLSCRLTISQQTSLNWRGLSKLEGEWGQMDVLTEDLTSLEP